MATNKFPEIYTQLREELLKEIYNDVIQLPSELKLVNRFKTSRNTICCGIAQLNNERLVYSVKTGVSSFWNLHRWIRSSSS